MKKEPAMDVALELLSGCGMISGAGLRFLPRGPIRTAAAAPGSNDVSS